MDPELTPELLVWLIFALQASPQNETTGICCKSLNGRTGLFDYIPLPYSLLL